MKKINIKALLILLFFGLGCAKQEEAPLSIADGNYNLSLDIGRAVEADANFVGKEQDIVTARMIVIATSDIPQRGRVTYNHSFAASELTGANKDVARAFVLSGQSDVYLIINEPADNTTALNAIENIEQLQTAIINFPTAAHSVGSLAIPMVQRYPTYIKPYPATTTVDTDNGVERLWAKVRVRFKATNDPALIAAGYPDMTGMIINKVQLHNVPQSSYVIAQNYPSASALRADDAAITKDHTLTTTESADAYCEFYVPEFLGATAGRHSFLKVYATTKEGLPRYYILDLKTTVAEQSFNLLRNTLYDIYATIRGYGQGDVDVVTNVLPWNKVPSSPEVGEYLTVNKTAIHLKHTIANSELVVQSHDLENTTVTADGGKVTVDYNKTTGVATLRAIYAPKILEPQSAYETITIQAGSLTKTVNIEYEPIVWAVGDIAADKAFADDFIFGTPDNQYILLFVFGSRVGVTKGPWDHTIMMWKGDMGSNIISRAVAPSLDYFKTNSEIYPGDPCADVNDDVHKWRTPTKEEFVELNKPVGVVETTSDGKRGYVFHGMKDIAGNDVFLNSDFHMRYPEGTDGLRGYYWSSTTSGKTNGWDFIADEHFGSDGSVTPTRVNVEGRLFQFPVRCVRDFR